MNSIGALQVTSCRLHVPESGSWTLEVDHDVIDGAPPPTGKVTCMVGGMAFVGTVDGAASGVFALSGRARIVGAIEWRTRLPKRDFSHPGGVTSAVVISATAAELGVPVVVTAPVVLGQHYARVTGPASQVLGLSGWWVDALGVTTVGPRAPSSPTSEFDLADYDPRARVARATSTVPIMPGMVVVDARLPGGSMRVREVTQEWTEDGASATLWMTEASSTDARGPRLASALTSMATAAVRPDLLTLHVYTVVGQAPGGGYLLQSEVSGPVPDATPVVHWPGVPGLSCTLVPGVRVLVGFRGREPVVLGFDSSPPTSVTWEYTTANLGGAGAKPTANADVIDDVLELLSKINGMHTGPTTAPYAGIVADVAAIKTKLATMKTRSS